MTFRLRIRLACCFLFAGFSAMCFPVVAQNQVTDYDCGTLENPVGPWDYRITSNANRRLVEKFHLDLEMATIQRGRLKGRMVNAEGYAGGGFDYTLRAMPNHPIALNGLDRYSQLARSEFPPELPRPVECYFQRAIEFQPDDAEVRVAYAGYLIKRQRVAHANRQLDQSIALKPNNASALYNLGLALFEVKRYDEALPFAHQAYALGFPLPGLKNLLTKAGKWREPAPSARIDEPSAQPSEVRPK